MNLARFRTTLGGPSPVSVPICRPALLARTRRLTIVVEPMRPPSKTKKMAWVGFPQGQFSFGKSGFDRKIPPQRRSRVAFEKQVLTAVGGLEKETCSL